MKSMNKTVLAVAITGICSTNLYAESFADSLANGTFSGEIRNVLALSSEVDGGSAAIAGVSNNSHVGSTALAVKYETAPFSGLKFEVAFQHGQDWEIHDEGTNEDDSRVSITSTSLQQAYIDYSFDKDTTATSLRLGRQLIVSPLLMNSGAFPLRDSFDALVLTNKDIPDTTLKLMYVDKWVMRYGDDSNGGLTQTDKEFKNNLISLYLNNNSIGGLNIEGQWLINDNDTAAGDPPTNVNAGDSYQTGFLGLTYKIPDTSWVIGSKVLTADYDSNVDTGYWGVKAQTKLGDYTVKLAYTDVDDAANFPGTLGHVPMFRAYHHTITNEYFAGQKTTSLEVKSGFGISGLSTGLTYAMWNQNSTGITNSGKNLDGGSELALDLRYKSQTVKGLATRIQLSQMDYDQSGEDDQTYLRATLNYAF